MTEEKRKELEFRKDEILEMFSFIRDNDVFMVMEDYELDKLHEEIKRHISIRKHLKNLPGCLLTENDLWIANQLKQEEETLLDSREERTGA